MRVPKRCARSMSTQIMTSQKRIGFRNMKLSRGRLAGKNRASCNALTFDADQSVGCGTDHDSGCNELQEREIQTASQSRRGDNHELPFVRPGRVHRRCVDHSCVSAPATGETSKLVPEVFTAERSRSAAYHDFALFRLQFGSVYRGGVLVFDQLGRAMEITQCQ